MFKQKRTYIILAAITVVIFLILKRAHKDASREEVTTNVREHINKPFANVSITPGSIMTWMPLQEQYLRATT